VTNPQLSPKGAATKTGPGNTNVNRNINLGNNAKNPNAVNPNLNKNVTVNRNVNVNRNIGGGMRGATLDGGSATSGASCVSKSQNHLPADPNPL